MENHSKVFIEPLNCRIDRLLTAPAVDLKVGSGKNLVLGRDVILHKVVDPFAVEPVVHQLFFSATTIRMGTFRVPENSTGRYSAILDK